MTTLSHPRDLPRRSLPHPRVRARVARGVLAAALRRVPVRVLLPDGSTLGRPVDALPPDAPTLEVVRPTALFQRLASHPKIGIGESYTAGDWQPAPGTDLAEALLPFAERLTTAVPPGLLRFRHLVDRRIPVDQRNSPQGARRNIHAHYDLSNELFAAFLDETMSYSSALFDERHPFAGQSLAEAQLRKVRSVLDLAGVGRDTRVLEIGTGWGTLAIEAARRGARVTTITLSEEQAGLAAERIAAAGFADAVDVRLADYREVEGSFDAVVSVEMIEAVGEEYWPAYFTAIDRLLVPGGTVALQAILMEHDRYLATRTSYGWIQKHVFPGGLIPSLDAIDATTRSLTALRVTGLTRFGAHYAETLRRWREAFTASSGHLDRLGFGEEFRRTWEFYLAYCQAGFAAGYLDVAQLRLQRAQARATTSEEAGP